MAGSANSARRVDLGLVVSDVGGVVAARVRPEPVLGRLVAGEERAGREAGVDGAQLASTHALGHQRLDLVVQPTRSSQ